MNAIEIRGLRKSYGDFTLDNVDLTLPAGCIMGLVGENGAGKTTTIKLIMNAAKKEAGEVTVLGCDIMSPEFSTVKEDVGIVLDEAYFPEVLTAKSVNGIMKNTYKRWDEKLYSDYLSRFALPLGKMFKDYSRGMKMKLAIAVALSHDPKLLILDEATSGLDPIVRDEILDIFNEFTRDEGHSILISSHIVSDLEKLCDYIAFIHGGKLVFCEEKDALLEEYGLVSIPKTRYDALPGEAVAGSRSSEYGIEVLVKRRALPPGFRAEKTSIENIVLFLVKGAKTR